MGKNSKYLKVVSVSLGSSTRDHTTLLWLNNKEIEVTRTGTNGDLEKAAHLFETLDGKVDAFGLGGTDLGLLVGNKWFPMHSVLPITSNVKKTPVVDGTGLKSLLEREAASVLLENIDHDILAVNKKVLIMSGCDRWGLHKSFSDKGFENVFGDLIFGLNLPFPLHSERQLVFFAKLLLPVFSRLPFKWIYPLGEKQLVNSPRAKNLFKRSGVIAGDCHYIRRYMPAQLDSKIIVTNTTTREDINAFKHAGVKYLVTTTPIFEGRSFGTNVLEAAIVAAYGLGDRVDYRNRNIYFEQLAEVLKETGIRPQFLIF